MTDLESTLSDLRSSHPELFSTIYSFNFSPASYLHPSQRNSFFDGKLPDYAWEEERVVPKISSMMLQEMEIEDRPYLILPDPKWPLALLSRERLDRLATYVGAVVLAPQIRAGLTREHVMQWKNRLGVNVYNFAMHSATLLPAITYRASFTEDTDIKSMGFSFIEKSLIDTAPEMLKRIKLKFPAGYKESPVDQRVANQIVQAIFIILEAEWHSLFTSIRR